MLIEVATSKTFADVSFHEAAFEWTDLAAATEIFTCGLRGHITPVTQLDGYCCMASTRKYHMGTGLIRVTCCVGTRHPSVIAHVFVHRSSAVLVHGVSIVVHRITQCAVCMCTYVVVMCVVSGITQCDVCVCVPPLWCRVPVGSNGSAAGPVTSRVQAAYQAHVDTHSHAL